MRTAKIVLSLILFSLLSPIPACSSTQPRDGVKEVTAQDKYELAVRLLKLAHATGNVDEDRWNSYYLPAIAAGDELIAQLEAAQNGGELDQIAVINAALDAIIEQLEKTD